MGRKRAIRISAGLSLQNPSESNEL